jgi:1,4-dihydroxy-2-naphthoate octaprenyltransferase
MNLKPWIRAARLRTLPLAAAGVLLGSFLAGDELQIPVLLSALATALLLQILSNYANDYGDYVKGTDKAAGRADRMLTSGEIKPASMRKALVVLALLSLISGLAALMPLYRTAFATWLALLFIGLLAIWAAIQYTTGKRAYGYYGMGELAVVLFFGLFAVNGTYYLHTARFELPVGFVSLGLGLLAAGVLNVNNTRDLVSDTLSNKHTIAVRLGFAGARRYQAILVGAGMVAIALPLYIAYGRSFIPSALLILLLGRLHLRRFAHIAQASRNDYNLELKRLSLSILAMVLGIGIWMWIRLSFTVA